jgi:rhodanese-related sulfurtransferase
MRRAAFLAVLVMVWPGLAALSPAQTHPPVLAGVPQTAAARLHSELGQGRNVLVIDVRHPKEYAGGHVPGAVNILLEELSRKIAEMKVAKDTTIVTVCDHGGRSSRAVVMLRKLGYRTSSFCTLDSWKKRGYKVEEGEGKPRAETRMYRFVCQHYCQADKQTADLDEHCDCRPYREGMKRS